MNHTSTDNKITISNNLHALHPSEKKQLCVIMPAYNEGHKIKENLLKTAEILATFSSDYQIIAINDGSKDQTEDGIIEASSINSHIAYVTYKNNQGKGRAIATGVHYANADYVAFLDSDLELDPSMLRYFMKALTETDADIAIGSKLHKKSQLAYPMSRRILSYGYFVFLKLLFNLNLKDTQTGIKLFKGDVIKPICANLVTKGFAFDIEILATASKQGQKIIELPITLKYSRTRDERSKVSIKEVFRVFNDTLKVKKAIRLKK